MFEALRLVIICQTFIQNALVQKVASNADLNVKVECLYSYSVNTFRQEATSVVKIFSLFICGFHSGIGV